MAKTRPSPLHPEVFYSAFGRPETETGAAKDENTVVPRESCTWATFSGPIRLTRGVPQNINDGCLRAEMRAVGVI
jgi:hypothetical protein